MMKLLTTREAAERLRLHPKTVEAYFRQGRIKALKTGRNWRVLETELESFISNHMTDHAERDEWDMLIRSKLAEVWNHPDEVEYPI